MPRTVQIRFYEELNDLIPGYMRRYDTEIHFWGQRSVKDLVESFGVPHTEVDLILANGNSVDFSYIVRDGDRLSVYPVFETLPIGEVTRLRPRPLRASKFACDVHLGKLARRLRLVGFDTILELCAVDQDGAVGYAQDERILLTRNRRLLKRKLIDRGVLIRSTNPDEQTKEVLERLNLRGECRPFTRCTVCNGILRAATAAPEDTALLQEKVPEGVLRWCNEFHLCTSCGKVYWHGSHYAKLRKVALGLLGKGQGNG